MKLPSDEDYAEMLKDQIEYFESKIKQGDPYFIEEKEKLKGVLGYVLQKIETGDGTCGSGLPSPYCPCEGCRYEKGELIAPNLKVALARRPLIEGEGYIYEEGLRRCRDGQDPEDILPKGTTGGT